MVTPDLKLFDPLSNEYSNRPMLNTGHILERYLWRVDDQYNLNVIDSSVCYWGESRRKHGEITPHRRGGLEGSSDATVPISLPFTH